MMRAVKRAASLLLIISVLMSLLSVAASAVDTVTLIQKDDRGQEDTTVVYTAGGEWNCLVFKQSTGAVVWTAEPVEDTDSLWAALQAGDPSLANSVEQHAFTTESAFSFADFFSGNPYSHTDISIDLSAGTVTVTGALSHLDFFQIPGETPEGPEDPTPASATLGGTKIVSVSGEGAAPTEVFTFVLTGTDGAQVDTATCTGAGNFTFAPITYTEAGTYTYAITEQKGSAANWTYDAASYTATVTVSEDAEGALTADVAYVRDGETADIAAFTNTYTVPELPDGPSVQATLGGTKIVSVSGEGAAPTEVFTFVLTGTDGAQVDTATCTGAGNFTFAPITYTEASTYTYTITEQKGSAANWTYDAASYTATVTVSEDAEGALTADVAYARDGETADIAAFANTYTVPELPDEPFVQATLGGTKTVSVSGQGTAPSETFTFLLTAANGTQVDTASCTGAGNFTFDVLTYTEAGTYTYTITEQKGSAANWTYDEASYTATVTVSEDTKGNLTADVAYALDGAAAGIAAFTNTYTVTTPPVDPPVIPPDTPTPTPEEPETPPEEIEEPDVPMGELPEEPGEEIEEPDVPMGELPEESTEEIEEPDVPLGEAPKTGDWSGLWLALSGLSGLSLAGLGFTSKKRDEE